MIATFSQIVFPPVEKAKHKEESFGGGFFFWFEKTMKGCLAMMVSCPTCKTDFCFFYNVTSERTMRVAVRTQGYYYAQQIKKQCPTCNHKKKYPDNINMYG